MLMLFDGTVSKCLANLLFAHGVICPFPCAKWTDASLRVWSMTLFMKLEQYRNHSIWLNTAGMLDGFMINADECESKVKWRLGFSWRILVLMLSKYFERYGALCLNMHISFYVSGYEVKNKFDHLGFETHSRTSLSRLLEYRMVNYAQYVWDCVSRIWSMVKAEPPQCYLFARLVWYITQEECWCVVRKVISQMKRKSGFNVPS